MIATLRHRLIRVPDRLIRDIHRPRTQRRPQPHRRPAPHTLPSVDRPSPPEPPTRGDTRVSKLPVNRNQPRKINKAEETSTIRYRRIGSDRTKLQRRATQHAGATRSPTCALSRAVAHGHEHMENVTSGVKATSDLASRRRHQSWTKLCRPTRFGLQQPAT
jgi:hypothetical protein